MRDFFTRHASATWARAGKLHVYLRADTAELREAVGDYHQALTSTGVAAEHGVGFQDLDHLHCTVQAVDTWLDELAEDALDELTARLTADLATVEPFSLHVGPPRATNHAVELWVDPAGDAQWARLVRTVSTALGAVLGPDAVPTAAPAAAHMSIGYGIGDGDSGVITSTLKPLRYPLIELPVTELELVAAAQHPSEGRYSWKPLAGVALAAS